MVRSHKIPYDKFMLDSPDPLLDGAGVPWICVQVDDRKRKIKFASVLRMTRAGDFVVAIEVEAIYGAPKLRVWVDGNAVVAGAGLDGAMKFADVPGFAPLPHATVK